MSKIFFKVFTILGLASMLACAGTAGEKPNTLASVPPDNLAKKRLTNAAKGLPKLGLPIDGTLHHILTLYLNETLKTYPSDPHIAIKYYDFDSRETIFQIFKLITDGDLESVFKMDTFGSDRQYLVFEEMEQFPSHRLPGVILWGGGYEIRDEAKVVCYANGRFQIVFSGGRPNFLDLDNDGIPEIFSGQHIREGKGYYVVHVWNGSEYVRVTTFADWEDRFSDEVRQAVKEAKKKEETKKP